MLAPRSEAQLEPEQWLDLPALLTFLGKHGGQEYRVLVAIFTPLQSRPKRERQQVWQPVGEYLLTHRGAAIEATGPSGQTRQLTPQRLAEIFAGHGFLLSQPTGRLTDLGPLFASEMGG